MGKLCRVCWHLIFKYLHSRVKSHIWKGWAHPPSCLPIGSLRGHTIIYSRYDVVEVPFILLRASSQACYYLGLGKCLPQRVDSADGRRKGVPWCGQTLNINLRPYLQAFLTCQGVKLQQLIGSRKPERGAVDFWKWWRWSKGLVSLAAISRCRCLQQERRGHWSSKLADCSPPEKETKLCQSLSRATCLEVFTSNHHGKDGEKWGQKMASCELRWWVLAGLVLARQQTCALEL